MREAGQFIYSYCMIYLNIIRIAGTYFGSSTVKLYYNTAVTKAMEIVTMFIYTRKP